MFSPPSLTDQWESGYAHAQGATRHGPDGLGAAVRSRRDMNQSSDIGVHGRSDDQVGAARLSAPAELGAILRHTSDAIYIVDHEWTLVYANETALAHWGQTAAGVLGLNIWSVFPQAVGSAAYEAHLAAARDRLPIALTARSPVLGKVLSIAIEPIRSGLAVIFREQTAEVASELVHRIKNMTAIFQGLVMLTFNGRTSVPEIKQRLLERVGALACATDVVVSPSTSDLLELISRCLAPYANAERLRVDAPRIPISPRVATTLAMALNELATNSLKHGALGTPDGVVACACHVEGGKLVLSWRESNAGPATAPASTGSGLRFLKAAFTGGATFAFGADGFVFEGTMTMPKDTSS